MQHSNEVAKGESTVSNDTLNLMKLGQVRCVKSLVTKDLVDWEPLDGFEFGLSFEYKVNQSLY